MAADPKGYYAILGIAPDAGAQAVRAAFRRRAKLLHPDMPRTGDADAFMRVREAYDVLGDATARAAYDRSAASAAPAADGLWSVPPAQPDLDPPPPLPDWWRVLPLPAWAGLGALLLAGLSTALLRYGSPVRPAGEALTPAPPEVARAFKPATAPASPPPGLAFIDPSVEPPRPGPDLNANQYVLPAGDPATLWRPDPARGGFVPAGALVPFTSVEAIRPLPERGFMLVRAPGGAEGYVAAARLTTGTPDDAHRAWCIQNAGAPPGNNEVLTKPRGGDASALFENRGLTPMVVKLRDAHEAVAATVFVDAGRTAHVDGLPEGAYGAEIAVGDLWSRRCGAFMAGMRTERAVRVETAGRGAALRVTVPPGPDDPPLSDIPEAAFSD